MEKLVGACMFGQSGGPSSVINSSAAGVFTEALKQDCITAVYGAAHGISTSHSISFTLGFDSFLSCRLELL